MSPLALRGDEKRREKREEKESKKAIKARKKERRREKREKREKKKQEKTSLSSNSQFIKNMEVPAIMTNMRDSTFFEEVMGDS